MKRLLGSLAFAAALTTLLALTPACDDDDPAAPPTTGAVSGTVTFQGTWPSTGDVQISIFSSYPPMGPPDAFTDPITQTTSYDYTIAGLTPGDYAAVVVGWRNPLNPSQAEMLGMYWAYVDSVAVESNGDPRCCPLPVTIVAGQTDIDIDMAADLDVAP